MREVGLRLRSFAVCREATLLLHKMTSLIGLKNPWARKDGWEAFVNQGMKPESGVTVVPGTSLHGRRAGQKECLTRRLALVLMETKS